MSKLYKFEMSKLHRSAAVWICLAIFVAFCCITSAINASVFNDSENMIKSNINIPSEKEQQSLMSEMTAKEKKEYQEQISWEKMLVNGASDEQIANMSEDEKAAYEGIRAGKLFTFDKAEAKFELDNNINSSYGTPSFIENALEHTDILMILMAVLVSYIVAKEYTSSTIKMSLLSPHRRDEIICAKVLTVFTVVLEMIAAAVFFCALTSVVFFMIKGTSNPEPFSCMKAASMNGSKVVVNATARLFALFGMALLENFMLSAGVVLLAVVSKSIVWTIVVPVALYIVPQFVTSDKLKSNVIWTHLFFNLKDNYLIWAQNSRSTTALWTALLATAIWGIVFVASSIFAFDKQDIYN